MKRFVECGDGGDQEMILMQKSCLTISRVHDFPIATDGFVVHKLASSNGGGVLFFGWILFVSVGSLSTPPRCVPDEFCSRVWGAPFHHSFPL